MPKMRLITEYYAGNPLGPQTGNISGDRVAGEYTTGIYDKAGRRAVGTADGHGWADRQRRIRRAC